LTRIDREVCEKDLGKIPTSFLLSKRGERIANISSARPKELIVCSEMLAAILFFGAEFLSEQELGDRGGKDKTRERGSRDRLIILKRSAMTPRDPSRDASRVARDRRFDG